MSNLTRSIRLIVHLKHAARPDLRQAVETVRSRGHHVEVHVAWEPDGIPTLTCDACRGGRVKTIVAAGGDGTLNAVAGEILRFRGESEVPSMGVLPLGTANDFAQAAMIAADDLIQSLIMAAENAAIPIDAGRTGDRYFLNVATAGVGASVTVDTPETMKRVLGKAAYVITGLREIGNLRPQQISVEAEGFQWAGQFLVFAAGNARYAGGGFDLCPDACLNDGLLDLCIVPDTAADGRTGPLRDIIQGGIRNVATPVIQQKVSGVTLRSESTLQVNLDGEPLEAREFSFCSEPGAIRFHLPDRCPLIRSGSTP